MNLDNQPFFDVLDEKTLAEGGMAIVKVKGRRIAVIRRSGNLHAIDNDCPHVGGYLGQGTLEGDNVVCPLHQMVFDLVTGKAVNRTGGYSVAVHEVKVENGRIWVR